MTKREIHSLLALLLLLITAANAAVSQNALSGTSSEPFRHALTLFALGHGDAEFNKPEALAFSPDGRLLAVSDTHNNRIQLFSVSQDALATNPLKLEMVFGDLWPWDDRTSPVDSADAYREKDFLHGRNPNYLAGRAYQHGQSHIRPGEMVPMDHFNLPVGITWLGTSTLLVADTGNHRVKALSLNGQVKWILGQEGWKDGYFHHPLGIDAGCDGRIYVTEPRGKYIRGLGLDLLQRQRAQGNRLQIFSTKLKPEKRLGHMHRMSGRDYRQYKDVARVLVNQENEVFLADNGNHRFLVYDKDLNFKKEIARWPHYRMRYPNGIDVALDGRIVISDTGNHKILILNSSYELIQIIGGFGTRPGRFVRPHEARFGPHGHLYVLDTGNSRIQVFHGAQIRQFPRCPAPEPPPPSEPPKLEDLLPPPSPPKDSL